MPKSVGMEEASRCSVCTRTPLVGETVTIVHDGSRESAVCDLCASKPRAASLGEPARRERVRSATGAANVRRIFPSPPSPALPHPRTAAI
ncbi:MAG: hypothetical protein U0R52_02650 [Solirubrobacterales bacterium]